MLFRYRDGYHAWSYRLAYRSTLTATVKPVGPKGYKVELKINGAIIDDYEKECTLEEFAPIVQRMVIDFLKDIHRAATDLMNDAHHIDSTVTRIMFE